MYRKIRNRVTSSDFIKNVAIIFTGSVLSQVIAVVSMPIVTRLYLPDEVGISGLFMVYGLLIGPLISFRYVQAILIAPEDAEAMDILHFCILSSTAICGALALLLLLAKGFFLKVLSVEAIGNMIFLLPLYIFTNGVNELLVSWLNRHKKYKAITTNRVMYAALSVGIPILWAFLVNRTFAGLIYGYVIGQFACTAYIFYHSFRIQPLPLHLRVNKKLLLRYKSFPLYTLPAGLINLLATQLPAILLGKFTGVASVGFYNMSNRILGMPSQLIATSIGDVFKQRATEDYLKTGNCRAIFLKTLKMLFVTGILPFAIIGLAGPQIFALVLGAKWRDAGVYSQILAFLFFLKFMANPLSMTFFIAMKQKVSFVAHIGLLLFTTIPFYLSFRYFDGPLIPIALYSVLTSAWYVVLLFYSYKYSKAPVNRQPVAGAA